MSAPLAGRESPEPEHAPEQVEHLVEGKADTAPSETYAKEVSEQAKDTVLSSNLSHPLERWADAKNSKEGRGEGIRELSQVEWEPRSLGLFLG